MPFTASHPAAVLPFLRTPLPPSALVAGSVAPDVPYYLPTRPGWPTHTATGVVTVDLLLGLLAWALWHGLLAAPALATAPAGLRARLVGRVELGLRRRLAGTTPALVVLAVAVGAATHVLLDEFTHAGRWGPEHLPVLDETYGPLPAYRWLQYAGGVVGAAVLAAWLWHWWRHTTPAHGVAASTRSAVAVPAVLLAVGLGTGLAAAATADGGRRAAVTGVERGIGATVLVAVLLAVAWWLRTGRHRNGRQRDPQRDAVDDAPRRSSSE